MPDAADTEKEVSLWPYVLQFALAYIVATAAVAAVIFATGWQGNSGLNIGILVASVILPMHRFVSDQGRALTRREQLRFAMLGLLVSCLLWPALTAIAVAIFVGPEAIAAWASGWQYVAPSYLILFAGMLIFACVVVFAALYFVSGMISRIYHRQLTRRGTL